MHYFTRTSFLIEESELRYNRNNHINIRLGTRRFQVIKGTVYNQENSPCSKVVVRIVQINSHNQAHELLGYVVTDEHGDYLFVLEANPCMTYELTVFASLD